MRDALSVILSGAKNPRPPRKRERCGQARGRPESLIFLGQITDKIPELPVGEFPPGKEPEQVWLE